MQTVTKVVTATILVLCLLTAGCSGGLTQTQQTTMKGGMVGARRRRGDRSHRGQRGPRYDGWASGGMGVGYIYSKSKEGSD